MPAALILGATSLVGCGDDDGDASGECGAELGAKINAFSDAADNLVEVSADMRFELAVACAKIATDLGQNTAVPTSKESVTDAQLETACNAASASLRTAVQAAGSVTISVEGGQCRVNAQAQVDCEANCSAKAECTGGDATLRCDPGELSVVCEGECKAGATCQGSAEVEAQCQGTCDATCEGTCEGTCVGDTDTGGNCNGRCEGTCTGTCKGNCTLEANANIECGAEARCKGGCEGTATAPRCEANIEAPECDLEAECEASCESSASLEAECEPIRVVVVAEGNAELESTLEANYPAVIKVARKGGLALEATGKLGSAGASLLAAATSAAGQCLVSIGTTLTAQGEAAVSAAASVSVSVEASASVSGSASGSTD